MPCTSLFKTVTVRCGHCTNLLPVNMRALLLPSPNQFHLAHNFFSPSLNLRVCLHYTRSINFFIYLLILLFPQEDLPNPPPNFLMNQTIINDFSVPNRVVDELPRPPVINRREFSLFFGWVWSLFIHLLKSFDGFVQIFTFI